MVRSFQKKGRHTTVEEQINEAKNEWKIIQKDIENGNIVHSKIAFIMGKLNGAHGRAIKENKRHLLEM